MATTPSGVLLFGGAGTTILKDTWLFNTATNSWSQITDSSASSARYSHAMATTPSGVLLFGGYNGSTLFNDTWLFNIATNNWSQVSTSPTPPARLSHAMATTPSGVLLFGGLGSPYYLNDTWLFNAATIAVTSPNSGETWEVGTSHAITWTSTNLTGNLAITLSRNGGSTYTEAIAASVPVATGSYSWVVTGPASTACRVKITSLSDPAVFDASEGNFTLSDLSLTHTVTYVLQQKWNMITLPVTPTSTDPQVVFGGLPSFWYLLEWNPLAATYIGKELITLRLGVGYWLYVSTAAAYSVSGQPNGEAQSGIDLGLNWNLIGVPYEGVIPWGAVRVSRYSGALVTLDQAVSSNWILGMFLHWSGSTYEMLTTGGSFQSLFGYWVYAKVGDTGIHTPWNPGRFEDRFRDVVKLLTILACERDPGLPCRHGRRRWTRVNPRHP